MRNAFQKGILVFICVLTALTTHAQRRYEQMGIQFKIPKDWAITEETPEKNAYSFSCEKEGDIESGNVDFVFIGRELDMNAFLALCMQNAENSAIQSEGKNFAWGADTTDVKVGDFIAKQVTYKVDFLNLPFSNKILVFKACGNMVMLNTTEADEDHAKNEKGFDIIMNSLSCK